MCRKFTGKHSLDKILYINSRNNIHQKEKLTQANSCEFFRDLCINSVPRCLIFQQGACNDLNKNGHHRPLQSNTIRRYGIVGVSVAPWEEVCQWRWDLRFQKLKPHPVSLSFSDACQSGCRMPIYFSSTMSVYMSLCFSPWQ